MKNPYKEISEFLDKLKMAFLYLNTFQAQLDQIFEWSKDNPDSKHASGQFFELSIFSLKTMILLETYKIASEREQMSIRKFLDYCRNHYDALTPSQYEEGEYRKLNKEEYIRIIDDQISELNQFEDIIENLKGVRDKSIAHADQEYFQDQDKLYADFPIDEERFFALVDCLKRILRKQISLIKNSDSDLERIYGSYDAKGVLTSLRGFDRFRKNRQLRDAGVWFAAFKQDDYNPDLVIRDDFKRE